MECQVFFGVQNFRLMYFLGFATYEAPSHPPPVMYSASTPLGGLQELTEASIINFLFLGEVALH